MSANVSERTPTSETPRSGTAHVVSDTRSIAPQSPGDSSGVGAGDDDFVSTFPNGDDDEFLAKIAAAQAGCTETLGEILASLQAYLFMIAGQYWRQTPEPQQNPSDIVQMAHVE